jgi:beta-galactosidase
MVRRDRNHPCVVLWSIGNENPEQTSDEGRRQARRLAGICREEDPTRPVTAACNAVAAAIRSGYADALDVLGINYSVDQYAVWKGQRKLIASETSSTVSTRGEYNLVLEDGKVVIQPRRNAQCAAYDIDRPKWAVLSELQLKRIKESPWMAGEFVWTGFDYLGEPTPFPWPAVSSYFGIVDLCGFPKDRFYLYQSQWTADPMVHILPHWNWSGFEGRAIPVWCCSNADTVELFLDGKSLGEQRMGQGTLQKFFLEEESDDTGRVRTVEVKTGWMHVAWDVPYRPGALRAVAKRSGRIVATDEMITAGPPATLSLSVDRPRITADGQDLAFVTVRVLDTEGVLCPNADMLVRFDLQGPGTLAAVGSGNPTSHEDFRARQRKAFHGLCLAIVKGSRRPGVIRLRASADGLHCDAAEISVEDEYSGQTKPVPTPTTHRGKEGVSPKQAGKETRQAPLWRHEPVHLPQ